MMRLQHTRFIKYNHFCPLTKKILVISNETRLGGAEMSLLSLLGGLPADKYSIVVALPGKGPLYNRIAGQIGEAGYKVTEDQVTRVVEQAGNEKAAFELITSAAVGRRSVSMGRGRCGAEKGLALRDGCPGQTGCFSKHTITWRINQSVPIPPNSSPFSKSPSC